MPLLLTPRQIGGHNELVDMQQVKANMAGSFPPRAYIETRRFNMYIYVANLETVVTTLDYTAELAKSFGSYQLLCSNP